MKKTWKRWLGTVAAALVTSTAMAQRPDDIGVATTRGQSPNYAESDEATIQAGRASASASGIQRTQFVQSVDPGDVFEDALGGGYYAENGGVGFASTSKPIGDIIWRLGRQNLDSYGFDGGYTNLNAFVPLSSDGTNSVLFLNPRVNFTDYRRGGANVGLGYRFYDPGDDRVYGMSGWWDYDSGHRGSYHNMGMHLESIGRWMSLRGGFAIPVGKDQHEFDSVLGNAQFVGNQVVATRTTFFEQSYANYNAEISTPLPGLARYGFDIGTGIYLLNATGKGGEIVGTSFRTQAQVTEDLWINGTFTYDSQFKSQFSLNMEMSFPDGPPSRWFRRNPVQSALTATALRNYRIAVSDENKVTTEILTNPGGGGGGGGGNSGQPITIAFIDPDATVAGNGSQALPFMSLADYMSLSAADRAAFDIIYVQRRDDLTDVNLNTTLTLLDYQKILGDGLLPDGTRPQLVSGQGAVTLPGTNGPLPLLSNSAAPGLPVITLNDANEVSGFTIDGTGTAAGIVGTGIDSFNIHDVFIQNVTDGIVISSNTTPNLSSTVQNYGVIQDVSVTSSSTGDLVASNRGISITHTAGTLDLLVRNNTITGFRGEDANGNGVLDPSEDTNNNGLLDVGEDIDFDAILDPDEDKNSNTILDRGIGIEIVGTGGTINANDPTNTTRPTGIDNNTFDQNGNGLSVRANPGGTINATVASNTATNGTDVNGRAFELIADGGILNLFDVANNNATGGLGDGLVIVNQNGGTLTVQSSILGNSAFSNNAFTNNGGDGLKILVAGTTLTIADLSGITFSNNTGDGLELQALAGGVLNVTNPMTGSSFANNGENGLNVNAAGGTINIQIGDPDADIPLGNTFTGNGESGLVFNTSNNGVINTGLFLNQASNNGADGVQFNVNTGEINVTGISGNTLTNNRDNGLSILSTAGGVFETPFISDNSFNDNDEAGMFIGGSGGLVNGIVELGSVTRNTFNRTVRGTAGIEFDTDDVLTHLSLTQNQFIGGNAATTFGVGGTVRDGGLDMSVGSVNSLDANTFTNNRDAHIGLIMEGSSVNNVEIDSATFTGAIDVPGTPDFLGDGVTLILADTATITGHIRDSQFLNNAGDGARLFTSGNNDTGNVGTPAAMFLGFEVTDNLFQGNGDDGLHVERQERGQFNNLLIQENTFTANLDDGLFIDVGGVSQANLANGLPDTIEILQNDMTNNAGDGVEFRLEADADLIANMDLNLIDGNEEDGIYVSENINDARDSRSLTGRWTRNQISNNLFSGIQIQSRVGNSLNDPEAGRGLIIGDSTINAIGTQSDLGNLITRNGLDGVQFTGVGTLTIGNNEITFNGTANANGTFNNAGINIQGQENEDLDVVNVNGQFPDSLDDDLVPGIAIQEVIIRSNLISRNIGDGIRWINESGTDSFDTRGTLGGPQAEIDSSLTAINNEITLNQGRGVSAINRPGDTDTTDLDNTDPKAFANGFVGVGGIIGDLNLIGNHVKANLQEGIYIINTNATDQSAVPVSSALLSRTGGIFQDTFLRADIHNNQVIGNGNAVDSFSATGLVVRVGTSGGGYNGNFDGGLATDGTNAEDLNGDGLLDNDLNGDGLLNATGNLFAGVSISVTGNSFDGNAGDDILFHSFASTVDPPVTGGAWDANTFTPANVGDPLARMDLIFSNNAFGSIEGNSSDNTIVNNQEPGAYYDNPEGVFKSRLGGFGGPFGDPGRVRNAQRLASRYLTGPQPLAPFPPVPAASLPYLYSGMGDSTFRVRGTGNAYTDQGLGPIGIGGIFILDDPTLVGDPTLVDAVFEARGVFPSNGSFGGLPWGWGQF